MKTILSFTIIGLFILIIYTTITSAQDWKKIDPKMNKILVDTTLMRVTEVNILPQEKSGFHTHPVNFFYALTDGKAIVNYTDGKSETINIKTGEYGYSDPERPHTIENLGDKPIKFLLVELKEHPYKTQ